MRKMCFNEKKSVFIKGYGFSFSKQSAKLNIFEAGSQWGLLMRSWGMLWHSFKRAISNSLRTCGGDIQLASA